MLGIKDVGRRLNALARRQPGQIAASVYYFSVNCQGHRHRSRDEAARYKETAVQLRQWWFAVVAGTVNQHGCHKRAGRVYGEVGVLEAEPAAGKRIPSLVDRFFRAEQQPPPVRHREGAGQRGQDIALARDGNQILYTVRQRAILLGVDANACEEATGCDRGGSEASGVSNAANDPCRPVRFALPTQADRAGRMPELGKGLARAAAGRHELTATAVDRVRNQVLLAGEYRFAGKVLKSLNDRYTGGQELFDHPASTFFGVAGGLARFRHSVE